MLVHNGRKETGLKPVNIDHYPAVKAHLQNYYKALAKRSDKGVTPYNLRNCAYMEDFFRQKIIFQEMVQEPAFILDNDYNYFCLDTARIITGKDLDYLLGIFNSKLFFYTIKNFYGGGGLGISGVRMKHTFFQSFPCIKPNKVIKSAIINTIRKINLHDGKDDVMQLEQDMNNIIYKMYNLTKVEIDVVENFNEY